MDYKDLYFKMFNNVTEAIEMLETDVLLLKNLQVDMEEEYISNDELLEIPEQQKGNGA